VFEYEALRIRLQPGEEGTYTVLASGPSGDVTGEFRLPFQGPELENFILRISRPRRGVRSLGSPEMTAAQNLGSELFKALFRENLRDLYYAASAEADAAGKGLRITLLLGQAPELMNVPWEYLCDDGRFLSVSERTPIVRYLDLKKAHKPLPVEGALKIVGMVSSPTDVVELDVQVEQRRLEKALEAPIRRGEVKLVWLENATLTALHEALESDDFHIFHFIGHGDFDEQTGDGVLVLEDDRGRARPVTGTYLGQLLSDERTLQLAVLNACEGARAGAEDPFAGVATSLVKSEIPSVIAMQFEITDDAAILFAGGFYSALARGAPVDAALAAARKAIWANYNDIEWGTPVLFMRVPDGRVFDVTVSPEVPADPAEPELSVALSANPPVVDRDGEVVWTLSVENSGGAALSDVSALGPDGAVLLEPSDVEPGQSVRSNWRSRPSSDVELAVTVSATDPRGDQLTEQATGRVTVRPREAPPEPGGGEEVPWWRRRTLIVGAIGLALAAILVAVVLVSRGGNDPSGSSDGTSAYATAVLADDPIVFWPLDGDRVIDESGNGRNGTYARISEQEDGPVGGTAPKFERASYVRGPALDLAGAPFTIELWAKNADPGENQVLFSQGSAKPGYGLHLAFRDTNQLDCDFYGDTLTTPRRFSDGDWHLWACTYDPSTGLRRIYRDGDPVTNAVPAKGGYSGTGDIRLGKPRWSDKGFVGSIGQVAVYRQALSEEQIKAHYEAGLG
jgi:hypothetical protein